MEQHTQNEKRRILDSDDFFSFLETNRLGRNPRNLCVNCLSFLSHYQKIKHREDHTILTPASFDSKSKYLILAQQYNWLSANGTMFLIPLDKPPKWNNNKFAERREVSAPPYENSQIINKEVENTPRPRPKAKSFKELLSIYAKQPGTQINSTPASKRRPSLPKSSPPHNIISPPQVLSLTPHLSTTLLNTPQLMNPLFQQMPSSHSSSAIQVKKQAFLASEKLKKTNKRGRALKKKNKTNQREDSPEVTKVEEEQEEKKTPSPTGESENLSHYAKTQRKSFRIRGPKKVPKNAFK